jgi:hypothetical protein
MYIATMDGLIVEEHLVQHYKMFHLGRGYRHRICSGIFHGTSSLCVSIVHVFPEEDLEPGIDMWVGMEGYDADGEPPDAEPSRLLQSFFMWDFSRLTGRLYEIID